MRDDEVVQDAAPVPPVHEISLVHRCIAAGGASVVSALIVNPLDVVKTRLQIQTSPTHSLSAYAQDHALLERWSFAECGPAQEARAALGTGRALPFSGTLDGLWRIARGEGARALWRGTTVSLAMSVPMVGIYLPLYDALLSLGQGAAWAPLAAGTLSRTAAVLATAPFELVRTRLQARGVVGNPTPASSAVLCEGCDCPLGQDSARPSSGNRNIARLWRGVGSQLARDVPFSALYWGMVEPLRSALMRGQPDDAASVFQCNVAAGAIAGALAGATTTPLDVVKTRVQVASEGDKAPSMARVLRDLAASEGLGGLFRGWSARAGKAAPACAIVLSAYEGIKHWHALD